MMKKILIIGVGYVGLPLGLLLSRTNDVYFYDNDKDKQDALRNRKSLISDKEINDYLSDTNNKYHVLNDLDSFVGYEFIILALPTSYDHELKKLNTSIIESYLERIKSGNIIIKSTVPVGFNDLMNKRYPHLNIIFSPEFLRESHALYDNLYPSRIIVGLSNKDNGPSKEFADLLLSEAKNNPEVMLIANKEAEAVKLFSNTYLALRVAFFNELDSFSLENDINSSNIIKGVGLDKRIGDYYNNPSFGYGGYCLPKDTKELQADYGKLEESLISATIKSNEVRKKYIASKILEIIKEKDIKVIGVYRLIMKEGSDNFKESSILDILSYLKGLNIIIYEPLIKDKEYQSFKVVNDLNEFKNEAGLILANRMSEELDDVKEKVFSRDNNK